MLYNKSERSSLKKNHLKPQKLTQITNLKKKLQNQEESKMAKNNEKLYK
jgi:hypothetical protein